MRRLTPSHGPPYQYRGRVRAVCPDRGAPYFLAMGQKSATINRPPGAAPAWPRPPRGIAPRRRDVVDRQRAPSRRRRSRPRTATRSCRIRTSTRSATPAAAAFGERDFGPVAALVLPDQVHAHRRVPVGSRLAASISTAPRPHPGPAAAHRPSGRPAPAPPPGSACRAVWCAGRAGVGKQYRPAAAIAFRPAASGPAARQQAAPTAPSSRGTLSVYAVARPLKARQWGSHPGSWTSAQCHKLNCRAAGNLPWPARHRDVQVQTAESAWTGMRGRPTHIIDRKPRRDRDGRGCRHRRRP